MLVLVKNPTPVRIFSISLIESFSLLRTSVDIESDNVWEPRQYVILHLYKMIRVDCNQFDKHFCVGCVQKQTKMIFPSLYTSYKYRMRNEKFVSY